MHALKERLRLRQARIERLVEQALHGGVRVRADDEVRAQPHAMREVDREQLLEMRLLRGMGKSGQRLERAPLGRVHRAPYTAAVDR